MGLENITKYIEDNGSDKRGIIRDDPFFEQKLTNIKCVECKKVKNPIYSVHGEEICYLCILKIMKSKYINIKHNIKNEWITIETPIMQFSFEQIDQISTVKTCLKYKYMNG